MRDLLATKLLTREYAPSTPSRSYRSLYSDRSLIADLDIVNELDGHSGCVNALSWSTSGKLLASGSDDQHLNIHTYQPASTTNQFQLTTTVATGHTANIFSVKFMPHHNDRTVITAAGDGEVRIFDLEYAGQAREASASSSIAAESRRRGRNTVYSGVKYLTDGDTDSRVYRSHGNRVKRIVTESSPHLFLTCSEDGEVRQWDLRQPSSAYPSPRDGRYGGGGSDTSVPPPLISYKRYNLDLNTISCSPSQPHYIALGGAHLHAFLHDRRMTGRDKLREAGKSLSPSATRTADEEELMSQATQCVRKFAPKGQQRMKGAENGHITALKISDARPDEMVVSWSGDHIYSFDLVRSPDAREIPLRPSGLLREGSGSKMKESRDRRDVRKRKRKATGSSTSLGAAGAARGPSRSRTDSPGADGEAAALRVRYQNGQSEDIPIARHSQQARADVQSLTAKQREARRIAKTTVKIRSALFGTPDEGREPTQHFTAALDEAAAIISDFDETIREWRYPLDPTAEMVVLQRTLRQHRESARRFVQGAGTLARVLGGKLQTASSSPSPLLAHFASIEARSNDLPLTRQEHFGYDFVKAILLWLESGIGQLISGFTRPTDMSPSVKAANRLPIPESEASTEAVDDILIPYLLRLASPEKPIVDVQTNRFEVDANRHLFSSEKAAVLAFGAAVRTPFADLSSAVAFASDANGSAGSIQAQDRQTALYFWGRKVARGVLLNAAEGVNFTFVDRAFGGLGRVVREVQVEGQEEMVDEASASEEGEGEAAESMEVADERGATANGARAEDVTAAMREAREQEMSNAGGEEVEGILDAETLSWQPTVDVGTDDDEIGELLYDDEDEIIDDNDDDDEEDEDDQDDNETTMRDDGNASDTSSSPSELDGVPNSSLPHFLFTSAFERRRQKSLVEPTAPCHGPIRTYRGHCNVRTVKDVNYLGPDDSYVVSGSDDGNVFIWCRKTGELVNILEGDGEVVNVVQGHPYETMMAVSGIDHTVKIFSCDGRARAAARMGDGVSAHDASQFSSISWPLRGGRRVPRRSDRRPTDAVTTAAAVGTRESLASNMNQVHTVTDAFGGDTAVAATGTLAEEEPSSALQQQQQEAEQEREEDDEYIAPTGLASRKRMHDAYRITSNNDVERRGGNQDSGAYVTVRDLHPLLLLLARGGGGLGLG
ncbi:hypothetical protein LTR85_002690 [Meristemomyces frigidus]|nr:hypothetical protein LTR85_002690 [Meristemomyces frigidus]